MVSQQVRCGHDRVERVIHVMHHTGGQLTDCGQAPVAREGRLAGRQRSCPLLDDSLNAIGLGHDTRLQCRTAQRLLVEAALKSTALRYVASEQHRAHHSSGVIVQRSGIDLEHKGVPDRGTVDRQQRTSRHYVGQRAHSGTFQECQRHVVFQAARLLAFPQLSHRARRRLARRGERLCIRAHNATSEVNHANG